MKQSSYYHEVFMNNDWHCCFYLFQLEFSIRKRKNRFPLWAENLNLYLVLKLSPPDQMK
jgi:hypothetical protein